ncbi:hypothetical protein HWV62_23464 [Athelia sp. TMB]|nr:hypothetical protein HWV62_23464 [Athelia sp. TMB]
MCTSKTRNPNVEKDEDEDAVAPLSLLQRPLGVLDPPTTVAKTSKETLNEMMDQKKRMEHRKHLIKEAGKGYFSDLNATRRHGGKTWIAPTVMIREDKSLYFPNVLGSALDGSGKKHTTDICKGRISIISMLSSKISEIHVAGFTSPTHARFSSNPLYTPVSINLQENLLKSFLVSLFLSSIRKQVPSDLHPTYLVSGQNMEYVREPLGLVNKHVGYVYLLDENLKVRWAGCADAKPEEARALESCTGVLLDRLQKKIEGKNAVPTQL